MALRPPGRADETSRARTRPVTVRQTGTPVAMKAAVATRYGAPEVVHVEDVPRPAPQADEVLVRVHATTVNRTDCGFRAGHPCFIRAFSGITKPKHNILGNEFAGVVEALGDDVSRF